MLSYWRCRKKIEGSGSDQEDVDRVLEAIQQFEHYLMDEGVRLREHVGGDEGLADRVNKRWRWMGEQWKRLGDMNLASCFEKKGWQPKDTIWSKLGYAALRAMSVRTAILASLVPVGFGVAGATGGLAAVALRRGVGAFAGSNAGYQFMEGWTEKGLKRRVADVDASTGAEEIMQIKHEYDEFIKTCRTAEEADAVREGDAYKDLQSAYCEVVKDMFAKKATVEDLRLKENESLAKARTVMKRNRKKMLVGALAGGLTSAIVAPTVVRGADWGLSNIPGVGGVWGGVKKAVGGFLGGVFDNSKTPPREVVDMLKKPAEIDGGEGLRPFSKVEPPSFEIRMDPDGGGVEALDLPQDQESILPQGEGAGALAEQGSYAVREGDRLSSVWLDKNGGDKSQMLAVMEALRELQGTKEGLEQLRGFGISSGNIDRIFPNDIIDIDAIQEWYDPTRTVQSDPSITGVLSGVEGGHVPGGAGEVDTSGTQEEKPTSTEGQKPAVSPEQIPEANKDTMEAMEINLNEMTVSDVVAMHQLPEESIVVAVDGVGNMSYTDLQKYNPAILEKTFPFGSVGEVRYRKRSGVYALDHR